MVLIVTTYLLLQFLQNPRKAFWDYFLHFRQNQSI